MLKSTNQSRNQTRRLVLRTGSGRPLRCKNSLLDRITSFEPQINKTQQHRGLVLNLKSVGQNPLAPEHQLDPPCVPGVPSVLGQN